MGAPFDTLAFTKRLEESGMPRAVSEAISHAMQDVAMRDVATTADLERLEHSLTVKGIAGLVVAIGFLSAMIVLF